jgi:hypothetical protein
MATTLKVRLDGRTEVQDDQTLLVFAADYSDDRNQEWAKYTPSLSFAFTVKNECEAAGYEVGSTYTLTLEENSE